MKERPNAIRFKDAPMTLIGAEVKPGDRAPDFTLVDNGLADLTLASLKGRTIILSVVPSLDTGVCATQTRRFNQEATGLSTNVVVLTVSMDLPFAQKRFCGAEGIDRVITASDYKYRRFGEAYGALIKELGLLTRAVFVVDKAGTVVHAQYVDEVTHEPDYAPALEAARKAS
jgi:thiol peroxidase